MPPFLCSTYINNTVEEYMNYGEIGNNTHNNNE